MIVLLSLISVIALLFIFLDGLYFLGKERTPPVQIAALLAVTAVVFMLPRWWPGHGILIALGLLLLLYSFILLGMVPDKTEKIRWLKQHSYWAYAPMVSLLWAISGLDQPVPAVGVFIFLMLLIPVLKLCNNQNFSFMNKYNMQNVKKILELFHLLGGIFQFITVLVIVSDRVRFFEKIVDYFF